MRLIFRQLQCLEIGGCIQLCQFSFPRHQQRIQVVGLPTVTPCQSNPKRHSFIEFSQTIRIQFGAPQVAAQSTHRVLDLSHAGAQHINRIFEFRLDFDQTFQLMQRAIQSPQRTAVILFKNLQRALCCIQKGLSIGQPAVSTLQLKPLIRLRVKFFKFVDLPGQSLSFALQRILSSQRLCQ